MSYINSNDIFVYPCANRGEGFWESKLATEYSLRTLIPWKITKRSFVISDNPQDTNLEFVVNGYYFRVSDWRTKVPTTSNLWAHIKINTKPLVSGSENTESTEILIPYDNISTLDYNNGGTYEFHGILFDTISANNDQTETYPYIFHLQITDSQGNFMHRDSIEIACEEPIEQDNNTGELSLKIGNGLQVSSNKLITRLGNGLEFGSGTDGEKPIQIKLATNSGLTRDANGLKVTNAVSDLVAPNNILQSLKINNVTYTIPQGKTYTEGNGININNTTISAKVNKEKGINTNTNGTELILADGTWEVGGITKTANSGLQFVVCSSNGDSYKGVQIKLQDSSLSLNENGITVQLADSSCLTKATGLGIQLTANSGLEKTGTGLKMKYPLPSITGNKEKILAVNSGATGLEWITPPSGGSLPSMSGEAGNFLQVNSGATSAQWVTIGATNNTSNNTLVLQIGDQTTTVSYGGGGSSGTTLVNNNTGGTNYAGMTLYTSKITVSNVDTYSGLQVQVIDDKRLLSVKPSNGLNIDNNGLFIKLKTNSGLTCDTNGLALNSASRIINFTLPSSSITANFQAICSFVHNMLVIRFSYVGGANLDSYWINTSSISTTNFTGLIPYIGNNNGLDCNFICPGHTVSDNFGYFNLHINQSNMYNRLVLTGYTSFEGANSTTKAYISFKNFVRALHGVTLSIPIWTNMFNS